jgi:hypothetical protein
VSTKGDILSLIFSCYSQLILFHFAQLHDLIVQAASKSIIKAPSMEQQKKVERFARMEKERRKSDKMKRSVTKQSRRGGGPWDY